jgi:hypothetical protein
VRGEKLYRFNIGTLAGGTTTLLKIILTNWPTSNLVTGHTILIEIVPNALAARQVEFEKDTTGYPKLLDKRWVDSVPLYHIPPGGVNVDFTYIFSITVFGTVSSDHYTCHWQRVG